jgi:hypothetical protein
MRRQQYRLDPTPPGSFRLRYLFALLAVLAAFGITGQSDYEDARRAECAQAQIPQDYDPAADRCVPMTTTTTKEQP